MKLAIFVVLCGVLALAVAKPAKQEDNAPRQQESLDTDALSRVLEFDFYNLGRDHYNYAYDLSNGISAQENGELLNPGQENESLAVKGQFSYVGNDGVTYFVSYVADENGFQPQGAHLPK